MTKKETLKKRTLKAGLWLFVRKFLTRIINLAAIYILARELSPHDFGLVALATVALRLITSGTSQTTSVFVIFDNSSDWKRKVNTAFWLNVILLNFLLLILLIVLPYIVKFYKGELLLKRITLLFFVAFVFSELRSIPDALLKKQLLYHKLVLKDTTMDVLSAILSITMAVSGFGVWSLVIPATIVSILNLPISFILSKWLPSSPSLKGAREIMKYTIHIMGSNILTLLVNEGDTLITGKLLGFRELGIYNRAYASANLIVRNVKYVIAEVSFPSLASVNQTKDKLNRSFIRIIELLSIIGFPLTIGLVIVAREFILVFYGAKWLDTVLPMQILAIMALRRMVGSPIGTYFNASGKPQIMFKFSLFFTPIYLIGIFIGAKYYGIVGVASAVSIIRTIGGLVTFYLLSLALEYPFFKLLGHMAKPLMFSTFMGLLVYTIKVLFPINNTYIALILYSFVGILTYGILVYIDTDMRKIVMETLRALK